MALILVVDDVASLAQQYAYDLERLGGHQTIVATSGREALDTVVTEDVDCIILDLEMPGMDGFDVLRTLGEREVRVPVIVYTGAGNFDRCIRAVRMGAYGFIDKAESMERVVHDVENAIERSRLEDEVARLRRDAGVDSPLIGDSAPMRKLRDAITRVAPIPSPVLIVGESGSGKELVARELHRAGRAPTKAFVAVNCAALPDTLVESELFGHERGAFTGAHRTHRGAFERAARGTLFLDEVGELPAPAQAKLLRVIEEGRITRVGAESERLVDARVIAATHRDLEADVAAGRFRKDLYYRLNVHVLRVPPLRERLSDIPDLTRHLVQTICERLGRKKSQVSGDAMELLMAYEWSHNNVRELRNVLERMIIAAGSGTLTPAHVPLEISQASGGVASARVAPESARSLDALRSEAERDILVSALERNQWHITYTARELGLADHSSLLKIMRRHGLKRRS